MAKTRHRVWEFGRLFSSGCSAAPPAYPEIKSRSAREIAERNFVMKPLSECLLYTFIDTGYLRGRDARDIAEQLCAGGSDLIQLRAKGLPIDDVRRMALIVLPILTHANVGLVINDHPQLAAEIGAPLCHLGQDDFFYAG